MNLLKTFFILLCSFCCGQNSVDYSSDDKSREVISQSTILEIAYTSASDTGYYDYDVKNISTDYDVYSENSESGS